jgi:hypothetical protein
MQVLGWNAFVRVTLKPGAKACAWVPAKTLPSQRDDEARGPFAVGTRCGAFAIADAQQWKSMSSYEAERFCQEMTEITCSQVRPLFARIPLHSGKQESALVLARGGGDFSCPCYWGLNEHGEAVELIVDMEICRKHRDEAFDIPFKAEYLNSSKVIPALTEFGFNVMIFSNQSKRLEVQCEGSCSRFEFVDLKGNILSSSDRFGLFQSGRTFTYSLDHPDMPFSKIRLRVIWQSSTHSFARPNHLI